MCPDSKFLLILRAFCFEYKNKNIIDQIEKNNDKTIKKGIKPPELKK